MLVQPMPGLSPATLKIVEEKALGTRLPKIKMELKKKQ